MFGTGKISSSRSKECKRLPSSSSVANSSLELNWKGFLRSSTSSINIIVWCTLCYIRITHLILMLLLIVVVWCCLLQFKVNLFKAEFFFSVNKHERDSILSLSLTSYSSIQSELSLPQSSSYTFKMFPRTRARDWKLSITSWFGSNICIEANWLNVIFAQSDSWLSNSPLRTHFKTTL